MPTNEKKTVHGNFDEFVKVSAIISFVSPSPLRIKKGTLYILRS